MSRRSVSYAVGEHVAAPGWRADVDPFTAWLITGVHDKRGRLASVDLEQVDGDRTLSRVPVRVLVHLD